MAVVQFAQVLASLYNIVLACISVTNDDKVTTMSVCHAHTLT